MSDEWYAFPTLPERLDSGRFVLGEALGSGANAQVFRARDTLTDEDVALKLMETRAFDKSNDTVRFLAEARLMAQMNHPRIAPVFGVGKEQGYYWYALRYYSGGTLRDLVRREGVQEPEVALRLVSQVLDGLQAVHERGIVHRDVKARNILLDEAGDAVLVDFGLAHHPSGSVPYVTKTGIGMGSVGYTAPEQRNNASSVDQRADLYGLGAVLAWLVSGERPDLLGLPDENRPVSIFDAYPEQVLPVIKRSTAFLVEDRYVDCQEMAVDVQRALKPSSGGGAGGRIWSTVRSWFE